MRSKAPHWRGLLGIALPLIVAAGVLTIRSQVQGSIGGARAAGSYPPANKAAFGVTFKVLSAPTGTTSSATLPNGALGLSMRQAIDAAMQHSGATPNGQLPAGVQVSAQYGLFSDSHVVLRSENGSQRPAFQDVPVWMVTFTGPGVDISPSGGAIASGSGSAAGQAGAPSLGHHHEETVVIDATTGAFLISIT